MKHPGSTLLLESIAYRDGRWLHLDYHFERMQRSYWELNQTRLQFDLLDSLSRLELPPKGLFKVRLLYLQKVEHIEWKSYQIRLIHRLKLIEAPDLTYRYKWANRQSLQALLKQKEGADEILITQNGWLRDFSYANVGLFDGQSWWTPQQPLLKGTCRARLLAKNKIQVASIHQKDLSNFQFVSPINALMDLGEGPKIPIHQIE